MPEKKKIKRVVISKAQPTEAETSVKSQAEDQSSAKSEEVRSKRACFFCQNKSNPSYTDLVVLRRFLTDRAKILGKARSNICSKHQRAVAKNIKYARHLSLLPFVPKV